MFLTYFRTKPQTFGVSAAEAARACAASKAFGVYRPTQNADRVVREISENGGRVQAMELNLG